MVMTAVRIGFLGAGSMGARMARRLLDAGYALTVYNRTRDKTAPLAEHGATVAENPRRAAERADVVMSSLGDDTAVRDVLLGADGALAGVRPGSMVDRSQHDPSGDLARDGGRGLRVRRLPD
jgi:3-hydroxyisobutyrate dehydrogenase